MVANPSGQAGIEYTRSRLAGVNRVFGDARSGSIATGRYSDIGATSYERGVGYSRRGNVIQTEAERKEAERLKAEQAKVAAESARQADLAERFKSGGRFSSELERAEAQFYATGRQATLSENLVKEFQQKYGQKEGIKKALEFGTVGFKVTSTNSAGKSKSQIATVQPLYAPSVSTSQKTKDDAGFKQYDKQGRYGTLEEVQYRNLEPLRASNVGVTEKKPFEKPFFSIGGQKERLQNVYNVFRYGGMGYEGDILTRQGDRKRTQAIKDVFSTTFRRGKVTAETRSENLNKGLEFVAENPFETAGYVAGTSLLFRPVAGAVSASYRGISSGAKSFFSPGGFTRAGKGIVDTFKSIPQSFGKVRTFLGESLAYKPKLPSLRTVVVGTGKTAGVIGGTLALAEGTASGIRGIDYLTAPSDIKQIYKDPFFQQTLREAYQAEGSAQSGFGSFLYDISPGLSSKRDVFYRTAEQKFEEQIMNPSVRKRYMDALRSRRTVGDFSQFGGVLVANAATEAIGGFDVANKFANTRGLFGRDVARRELFWKPFAPLARAGAAEGGAVVLTSERAKGTPYAELALKVAIGAAIGAITAPVAGSSIVALQGTRSGRAIEAAANIYDPFEKMGDEFSDILLETGSRITGKSYRRPSLKISPDFNSFLFSSTEVKPTQTFSFTDSGKKGKGTVVDDTFVSRPRRTVRSMVTMPSRSDIRSEPLVPTKTKIDNLVPVLTDTKVPISTRFPVSTRTDVSVRTRVPVPTITQAPIFVPTDVFIPTQVKVDTRVPVPTDVNVNVNVFTPNLPIIPPVMPLWGGRGRSGGLKGFDPRYTASLEAAILGIYGKETKGIGLRPLIGKAKKSSRIKFNLNNLLSAF